MTARTLMIQGTSSSAGKSLLVAAFCRIFARRGLRVVPFKSQNMSNNAAVCCDGSEIGRSQALQALAASVAPHSDMNPILLKPEGDTRSQVIVNGRPLRSFAAPEYYKQKQQLWSVATKALDRLRAENDLVIIEGAGSPAELNLADVEIVNMAVARHCNAPVLLVGDIERGGVFAQLLGTLWLLLPEDRQRVKGLIVNKFRGDRRLFDRGRKLLQSRGKVPVLGVLPWIDRLRLPEEDAASLSAEFVNPIDSGSSDPPTLDIAVIHLPHLSNFDDFDPLADEPGVRVRFVQSPNQFDEPDVIILPGTKNTLGDLRWLRMTGLADPILRAAARGRTVIGICGGYQMLGQRLNNPKQLESEWHSAPGLQLLDIETTFSVDKRTQQVEIEMIDETIAPGTLHEKLVGYEIHTGHTRSTSAWLRHVGGDRCQEGDRFDGARSSDGRIWGCYLHGLFHNDAFRAAWLRSQGLQPLAAEARSDCHAVGASLDRLADAVENNLDMNQLVELIWNQEPLPTHV